MGTTPWPQFLSSLAARAGLPKRAGLRCRPAWQPTLVTPCSFQSFNGRSPCPAATAGPK
jgi:hypothetical protein